jgi:hypothetical protein
MNIYRIIIALSFIPYLTLPTWTHAAVNMIVPGKFTVEPPTLLCTGFEWLMNGDDNRNAAVEVGYRKKGTGIWKKAHPLMRLQSERVFFRTEFNYICPNMFAGSIFNLEPGTQYECRFVLSDPDGVKGAATKTIIVTTRSEPKVWSGGHTFHVYPPDFKGAKQEPACTGIMEAYYGYGRGLWHSATIQPGDIILVHAGVYKANRWKYYEPMWMHFHGYYHLSKSGTQEKPIVIMGAGDGEAILDGDGVYRLFDVIAADYTYFENLTIRNCDVGIMAGVRYTYGCKGLTVKNCRFENVGCAVNAQFGGSRNFYIADNFILGREDSTRTRGWTGDWVKYGPLADLKSFIGIDINGQGHAVCHNYIAYFHDAIDVTEQGPPESDDLKACSIDFYNNDIHIMADDIIEGDSSVHNMRIFKNRGFNSGQNALSAQPIFGGPAYYIRNIVYHSPMGGSFKFALNPAGIIAYHNTFCTPLYNGTFSNGIFRNNLFLVNDKKDLPAFNIRTYTSYSTLDYDGYRINPNSEIQFIWKAPGAGTMIDYELKNNPAGGSFKTLEEFSRATGLEYHGVLVDYDIFKKVSKSDPENPCAVYFPKDSDFRLNPDSKAVDAGCILPNINDKFTGKAPDLGAIELDTLDEVYGPRTVNEP